MQRERAAVERERAASAKEATLAERLAKIDEFESIKKTNPRKALELLGLSYQDLTQVELNDGQITPDVKVRELEERFEKDLRTREEEKRQNESAQKQDQERRAAQAVDKFKGEIGSYLKDNATRYELIEFEQSQDLVFDVIDEHYNRTLKAAQDKALEEDPDADVSTARGEVLTIAQSADKVELHLEQKYQKAKDLKKVSALLQAKPSPKPAPASDKPQNTRQTPQTLNNNLSATPSQTRKAARTDEDRIAAAIAFARGLRP